MLYLFGQLLFWLLAVFVLGLVIGWWLHVKISSVPEIAEVKPMDKALRTSSDNDDKDNQADGNSVPYSWAPTILYAPPVEKRDDLKKISGIGNKLEQLLNDLGIYKYEQLANFNQQNIAWVNNRLYFSGRIEREKWVEQAKLLTIGQETDFSQRVDSGSVIYDKAPDS